MKQYCIGVDFGTLSGRAVLVDTANQEREHLSVEDALARAGKIRLRPILMTTLTTILAMVPMASRPIFMPDLNSSFASLSGLIL